MDHSYDKLSIKNLLFTKSIPNYVIPIPTNGHKIYPCTDCGDKFIFESSYNDHVNRKSAKISYMCRHCNNLKIFNNRCNLLCHIRSHAFKTATINVSDLKVELLPMSFYNVNANASAASTSGTKTSAGSQTSRKPTSIKSSITCYECKQNITLTGIAYKDRSSHFMQFSNQVYSCPICLFALPSVCALKVHLRLHLNCPPYYCPECGVHLANKNVHYPYNHDCEGFKMMRATARLNCTVPECCLFHPNDYKEHMKKYHLRKVYKCPFCVVACFNETTMEKHLKGHNNESLPLIFYQCDICPGKYVLQNPKLNDNHLKSHINHTVFPCWACGATFKKVSCVLAHFMSNHNKTEVMESAVKSVMQPSNEKPTQKTVPPATNDSGKSKIFRVVKKCDQCLRSFTYKCKYDDIPVLPNECPYKCTPSEDANMTTNEILANIDDHIMCHLCDSKVLQDWQEVKKHYAESHHEHKCLDAKIIVNRIDISKYLSRNKTTNSKSKPKKTHNKISKRIRHAPVAKSTSPIRSANISLSKDESIDKSKSCLSNICDNHYEQKSLLEKHIMLTHRDPCMAYQCMDCGQSFMVRPTFAKHLLLEHGITEAEDYILKNKDCYNANALSNDNSAVTISKESLAENQCNICLQQFGNEEDFGKHYRVHGMAFLEQNTSNKNVAPK